jgi:hypothetical protein
LNVPLCVGGKMTFHTGRAYLSGNTYEGEEAHYTEQSRKEGIANLMSVDGFSGARSQRP